MASPCGGASSGSSQVVQINNSSNNSSGSSEDATDHHHHQLQALLDEKRRKRKASNRESARRSRARRQRHLDELTAQVDALGKDQSTLLSSLSMATQGCLFVEAENSVLKAQALELTKRLQSLHQMLGHVDSTTAATDGGHSHHQSSPDWTFWLNPLMSQPPPPPPPPLIASPDQVYSADYPFCNY